MLTTTNETVEQWESRYFEEFLRENEFVEHMGTDESKPIQLVEKLESATGTQVTVTLVPKLSEDAIVDDDTLDGAEEAVGNYAHTATVHMRRKAIKVPKMVTKASPIDLMEAGKSGLKDWDVNDSRNLIIGALKSAKIGGATAYADCTEGEKDAWLVANSDRVLFGAVLSNYSGDHSVDLAKVDNSADKITPAMISLAKRIARLASPAIRPIRVDGGGEWYILYAPSAAFRDLKIDTNMYAANRDGFTRGRENPIFQDGDLLWDGVIVREVPAITTISSTIKVAPCFLVGAQALVYAWGQKPKFIVDADADFKAKPAVALEKIVGVEKATFNSKQNGVVTVYCAGIDDV